MPSPCAPRADARPQSPNSSPFEAVLTRTGALELNGDSLFAGTAFDDARAEPEAAVNCIMAFDWRESLEPDTHWFQAADTGMLEIAVNIEAPSLVINSASDTAVPPDNAEKIVDASTNEFS